MSDTMPDRSVIEAVAEALAKAENADADHAPAYLHAAEAVLAVPVIADALAAAERENEMAVELAAAKRDARDSQERCANDRRYYNGRESDLIADLAATRAREQVAIRHLRAVMEGPPPEGIRDVAAEAAALFLAGLPSENKEGE